MAVVYIASLCAELLQYVFNVGSFDLDDVILNTIGGLIGVLLSIPLKKKAPAKGRRTGKKK